MLKKRNLQYRMLQVEEATSWEAKTRMLSFEADSFPDNVLTPPLSRLQMQYPSSCTCFVHTTNLRTTIRTLWDSWSPMRLGITYGGGGGLRPMWHNICVEGIHTWVILQCRCDESQMKEMQEGQKITGRGIVETTDMDKLETLTSTISTSSPAVFGAFFFLSLRSRIARLRKRVCITIQPSLDETHLSLSSLMLVMTTLLGWIPMGTVAPFDLSR